MNAEFFEAIEDIEKEKGIPREYMYNKPWLMIFPGIALVITSLSFELLGDGLRDALDPRLKD